MYKINEKILHTPVEDGNVLLLEPETGMYFEMNQTAVFIYQAIELGLSQAEILEKMLGQFEVNKSEALSDIKSHIEHLLAQNIILKV